MTDETFSFLSLRDQCTAPAVSCFVTYIRRSADSVPFSQVPLSAQDICSEEAFLSADNTGLLGFISHVGMSAYPPVDHQPLKHAWQVFPSPSPNLSPSQTMMINVLLVLTHKVMTTFVDLSCQHEATAPSMLQSLLDDLLICRLGTALLQLLIWATRQFRVSISMSAG